MGGPGILKFRGVFREASKVRPWEALLQIFVIFWCPWGSRMAPFSAKNAVFEGSEILLIFGTIFDANLGGPAAEGWSLGT